MSKGPKHLRGAKRVEGPDKRRVARFCSLVDIICEKPLTRRFLRSDLSSDELKQQSNVVGMSFMYPKVREIHAKVGNTRLLRTPPSVPHVPHTSPTSTSDASCLSIGGPLSGQIPPAHGSCPRSWPSDTQEGHVQEASPTVPSEPRFEYGGEQPENKDAGCKSMEELAMAVAHLIRPQAAA
jgi:hypothetical protein